MTALQAACPPEELEAATRLYRGLAALSAEVKFGTGGNPSASFVFNAPVPPTSVFSLYTIPGEGSNFAVNFDFLEGRVSDKFLEELLEKDAATSRC